MRAKSQHQESVTPFGFSQEHDSSVARPAYRVNLLPLRFLYSLDEVQFSRTKMHFIK